MLCFLCIVYVLLWKGVSSVGRVIRHGLPLSTAVIVEYVLVIVITNRERGDTCTELGRYLS